MFLNSKTNHLRNCNSKKFNLPINSKQKVFEIYKIIVRQIIFWLRAIFPGYGCVVLCCNGNHFCNMVMPELARGLCFLQEIALGRARGVRTRSWNRIDWDREKITIVLLFIVRVFCLGFRVILKEIASGFFTIKTKYVLDFMLIANAICLPYCNSSTVDLFVITCLWRILRIWPNIGLLQHADKNILTGQS